jgi:transcriptional regulator NrdR family protein
MSMCPECGAWDTRTTATRKDTRFNWMWRRKRCNECDHRWGTYEIPTDCVAEPNEWANEDGRLVK